MKCSVYYNISLFLSVHGIALLMAHFDEVFLLQSSHHQVQGIKLLPLSHGYESPVLNKDKA